MSSSNRTTSKGGKGAKADNKTHKSDKSDIGKGQKFYFPFFPTSQPIFPTGKGSDKQHTNRDNTHSKTDEPGMKEKVRQLIELSQRSEEEVCLALHECDNDVHNAITMLLEDMGHVSNF